MRAMAKLPARKIRVILADDHPVVRDGLAAIVNQQADMEVVAEAGDGAEALDLYETHTPDVMVLDLRMPKMDGATVVQKVLEKHPKACLLIMTTYDGDEDIFRSLSQGAKGYLLKDHADEDLERAIQSVAAGKPYFSPSIAQALLEDYVNLMRERRVQDSYDLLTEREREVLQLLAGGKSNKEVASVLNISPYTIETHRNNLMQKLNLHNTAEIVLYAVRKALITP